jgi:uncharacterized membrane protein
MKKLITGLSVISMVVVLSAFTAPKNNKIEKKQNSQSSFVIPDSVKTIIDKSCFMCHNSNARGDAKDALSFDKLSTLSGLQLVSNLQHVVKMVSKDWMPPKRFLKDHPERALTPKERATLINWANEASNQLFSGKDKP